MNLRKRLPLYLIFLTLLFCFNLRQIFAKKKFMEISQHTNNGCPEDSLCSKEMGRKRSTFIKILKKYNYNDKTRLKKLQQFNTQFGIPINIWIKGKPNNKKAIVWDSPCRHHKFEITKIQSGKTFIKKILKNRDKNIVFNQVLLLKSSNKIWEYLIPRGDLPLFIENDNLYFIQEIEGNYYNIKISRRGKIQVVKNRPPKFFPEKVERCPKLLIDYAKRNLHHSDIFKSFSCKNIWNNKTKKFNTFLLRRSCN